MLVKTLIADKESMFLDGLELILTSGEQYFYRVVGRCTSSAEILERVESTEIDLIITDISLGDNDSSEFIKRIKKANKQISICVLSAYTADKFVRKSFIHGADGFVSKYKDAKDLLRGLAVIASGKTYLSDGLQMTPGLKSSNKAEVSDVPNAKSAFFEGYNLIETLTKREMEVLQLIAQAKGNVEIGEELFISSQTVGVHRKNIMRKLSVNSTNALIKFAFENGLV